MYKVFINDSSLLLTAKAVQGIPYEGKDQLRMLVEELEESGADLHLSLCGEDVEQLWKDFYSLFGIVEAAGGVVLNAKDEILMIYRRQKWDLPKGKREENESVEGTALREVMEECGIPKPEVVKRLKDTYHTYRIDGEPVLKRTYWYEMRVEGSPTPSPQTEEEITKVQWCDRVAVAENIQNSFGNIVELLQPYLQ